MTLLHHLRLCCYWMFLLFGALFLALSLFTTKDAQSVSSALHLTALYGTLLSLLLTVSFSITLLANPSASENHIPSTAWMTLGATLLVSGMIAAFLFFV